jgi:hypothetical protein
MQQQKLLTFKQMPTYTRPVRGGDVSENGLEFVPERAIFDQLLYQFFKKGL